MKKCKNSILFIVGALCVVFAQLVYLERASCNVPLMDYWHYINMFVDKMYTGKLTVWDIWRNDGIHRSPLQFVYFLLNVKLFHLNVQVEVYLGAVLMAVIAFILFLNLKKEVCSNSKLTVSLFGILIFLVVYNLNQYELLTEQFALSFASRMLLFLLSFVCTSNCLQQIERINWKKTVGLMSIYVITIISVGGGYFPAYVGTICFTIAFCAIQNRKCIQNHYIKYIMLVVALGLGTFVYMYGMTGQVSVTSTESIGIINFIINYLKGFLIMLAVSIIGGEHSQNITMLIGVGVFLIYIGSAILYLKKKYYKKTYVPMLFYGYSVCAGGLIYMGRMDRYGLDYAFAPRYTCETNIALLAFLWILILYLTDDDNKQQVEKKQIGKILGGMCAGILVLGVIVSDCEQWNIAPYRKIYGERLIQGLMDMDELSSEDFAQYQAEEQQVRDAVKVMQKYKLGIYRSYEGE